MNYYQWMTAKEVLRVNAIKWPNNGVSGTLFNNLIDGEALAKQLEMSLAEVGFSVERGESIAKDGKYSLEG